MVDQREVFRSQKPTSAWLLTQHKPRRNNLTVDLLREAVDGAVGGQGAAFLPARQVDQIFEIVVCAAVAEASRQYDTALAAISGYR